MDITCLDHGAALSYAGFNNACKAKAWVAALPFGSAHSMCGGPPISVRGHTDYGEATLNNGHSFVTLQTGATLK